MNTGAFGFIPALQFDTWIGLGDSYTSAPSTIGDIGLDNNLSGSSWSFGGAPNSDASIFRTPDDPLCVPDASGLVTSWTIYYIRNTFGLYKFRRSRC